MKSLIAFAFLMMAMACKNEPVKSKYFEGYVDYKIETVALDTSSQVKGTVKLTGNTMRCYFKKGDYVREYFDSNNISTIRFICQESSGRIISINRRLQYYYFSVVGEEMNKKNWTVLDSNLTAKILNKTCNGFRYFYTFIEGKELSVKSAYYYAADLPLDYSGKFYKHDPYFNYWKDKYSSVALLIEEEIVGKLKSISTATLIVPTKLSDTLFTVPNDKPLMHYPD